MEPDEVGLLSVPLSALQHYIYCPRRCALIHTEQIWSDNLYTERGRQVHEQAHQEGDDTRAGLRVERALPVWSERLGIHGVADVVEFDGDQPRPVEYKHGRRKAGLHDEVQLCAQALCLEEMLGVAIPAGDIYHHSSRRRREVVLDEALRATCRETILAVRELLVARRIPPSEFGPKCRDCSLAGLCLPDRHALGQTDWFAPPREET